MQLSTKIYSHAIITYAKSHHFITQEQNAYLMKLGIDGQIIINGNAIKTRNIAEILTIEKYYETYSNKKPSQGYETFKSEVNRILSPIQNKEKRIRALESMIKGFKKHFNHKEIPIQSRKILNIMEMRLKNI